MHPKVAVITSLGSPPYLGGIENVVDTLLRSTLKDNYVFYIFDTYRQPDPKRTILHKALFACRLSYSCARFLLSHKPDLVHIHFCSNNDFRKHVICLFIARILRSKTLFHLHGGSFDTIYDKYNLLMRYVVRRIFKIPHRVVALSEYWAAFLSEIVPSERLRIIHNPIDCARFAPARNRNANENEIGVLLLGCLGHRKGHYDVLKSMPMVLDKHPNVLFLFAGVDETIGAGDELKKIAEKYRIDHKVKFLGPVSGEDKIELLRSAAIMILPSYGENMPISLMEGMASKLPVIASTAGAIPELLENGKLGLLIQAGDVNALAQAIIKLVDDPIFAKSLAEKAFKKIVALYDIKIIADVVDSTYKETVTLK